MKVTKVVVELAWGAARLWAIAARPRDLLVTLCDRAERCDLWRDRRDARRLVREGGRSGLDAPSKVLGF